MQPMFDLSRRNGSDDIIDRLLEDVLALYPPERLERIRLRTDASWKGHDPRSADRISYVVQNYALPPDIVVPDDATEVQRELIHNLRMMKHNAPIDCEYYPAFNSGLEQVTVPSMFGCIKESISASEHVKPILTRPDGVYGLPEPEVREGYMCHTILQKMRWKYLRCNKKLPVYMTDIQGPFSVAAQVWGIQEFLTDLYEYPEQAHYLLGKATQAIVKYFRAMYEAVEGDLIPLHCHPYIWVPRDCGVAVSDDFFAVVSESTSQEFSVPYLERIGREFGGVTSHTCGNMNHLSDMIYSMDSIRAMNFGASETSLRDFARSGDTKVTFLVHPSGMSCMGLPLFGSTSDFIRHCAVVQRDKGVNVVALAVWTGEELNGENMRRWEEAARVS